MSPREFLMLAHTWDRKTNIAAWYISTKYDGMRCYYDGGITRGFLTVETPWANIAKEYRYKIPPRATGLWSRYGRPIQAPAWFLDQLPDFPLDGELWMARGQFQKTMSICKTFIPPPEWRNIAFLCFDCPSYREMFVNGEIRLKKKYEVTFRDFLPWVLRRAKTKDPRFLLVGKSFEQSMKILQRELLGRENVHAIIQRQLPYNVTEAKDYALEFAEQEVAMGGEGAIVRMGSSMWIPKRVRTMLKVKPFNDDEGLVEGYTWGRETDLGSKLMGKMGAMIVRWRGKSFKLSGFTDEERIMYARQGDDAEARAFTEGCEHPGERVNMDYHNPKFPRGSTVTFQYRELTDDSLPKEARFLRLREEE